MDMGRNNEEDRDEALAALSRLICSALLEDPSVVDAGSHLEIHLSSVDFQEKLSGIVAHAMADIPRDRLMSILISMSRQEMRQNGFQVLTDNELPPGFSSN